MWAVPVVSREKKASRTPSGHTGDDVCKYRKTCIAVSAEVPEKLHDRTPSRFQSSIRWMMYGAVPELHLRSRPGDLYFRLRGRDLHRLGINEMVRGVEGEDGEGPLHCRLGF